MAVAALVVVTVAACGGSDDVETKSEPTPACEECAAKKYWCKTGGSGESVETVVENQRGDGCSLRQATAVYDLSCDPLRVCYLTTCADALSGSSLTWSFPQATHVCTPATTLGP
ncbi:MAG: hypothetical protein U0263_21425 [Polyangiaceae bacterium]